MNTTPEWLVMLKGGAIVALIAALREYFVKGRPDGTKVAELAEHRVDEEREVTLEFATEERNDRRRMEREIRDLREQLLAASVELATMRGDRDSLLEMVSVLRTHVDMQSQLIERQKSQIDDLVRRLMTRENP